MKKLAVWLMLSVMFCTVVSVGCGGGGGGNSPDSEQTESLTDDTGSTDPNSGGRGTSDTEVIDLSTIDIRYPQALLPAKDGDTFKGRARENLMLSVADGATITLRGVILCGSGMVWHIPITGLYCEGDATIILEGTNYVKNFYWSGPAIYVPEGHTLTIKGSGTLIAEGGDDGAGIGGGNNRQCGNIVIEGGTIDARGNGGAAGIGGGENSSCGTIIIKDSVTQVTATKGNDAPNSIGAGKGGSCGEVTIGLDVGEIAQSPYTYPPDEQ